ncbi:MAG: EAL domain-containing protein [Pseudomonadota bacterium]
MDDLRSENGGLSLEKIVRSVHRYTSDVIVISEAEPVDQPGPRIVFVNDAFVKHTGYSREEAIGQSPRILQGPKTDKATTNRIRERLKAWMPVREQVLNYRKDGSEFWAELSIVPVADEAGWWTYWVSVQRDITEAKQREHSIEVQRDTLQDTLSDLSRAHRVDDLTGLGNKHELQAWAAKAPPGADIAFLNIRLDGLSGIIGTYGQATADAVLRRVASRLRTKAQEKRDLPVRLGEREFGLASMAGDARDWVAFGKEVTDRLSDPIDYNGHPCSISCRAGFASGPLEQLKCGDLIAKARDARSQTAPVGTPQVLAYEDSVAQAISDAQGLAKDFGLAISRKEVGLHLMPQVSAHTGSVTGYEALSRWNHEEFGLMMPSQFMPLAAQMNLLPELDRAMLEKAVAAQAQISAMAGRCIPVSVNVSALSLFNDAFVADLLNVSNPNGSLALEIVEDHVLKGDEQGALGTLERVRSAGYRIDLDDFGSGSSSIVGLTKLRPDRLKIDHRLTLPILDSIEKLKLAEAIVSVGKALNIPLIAEGVQTEAHARKLRKLGVDHFQGYFIGQPQPLETLEPA